MCFLPNNMCTISLTCSLYCLWFFLNGLLADRGNWINWWVLHLLKNGFFTVVMVLFVALNFLEVLVSVWLSKIDGSYGICSKANCFETHCRSYQWSNQCLGSLIWPTVGRRERFWRIYVYVVYVYPHMMVSIKMFVSGNTVELTCCFVFGCMKHWQRSPQCCDFAPRLDPVEPENCSWIFEINSYS